MAGKTFADGDGGPLYRRVDAQPLRRSVAQQITRQIVAGTIKPGEALPIEPRLAAQFGVSRTVVREAVQMLVSRGLLSVKQGSGMRVREPDEWDYLDPLVLFEQVRSGKGSELLHEVLEVRRLLEAEAARLAAVRRAQEDLPCIQVDLELMQEALQNPREFTRLDIRFHEHIMQAAHNRPLREALRPINEVLEEGRYITNRRACLSPGGAKESQRGHEEIYTAIEKEDSRSAQEAMRRHIELFEHDIHAGLIAIDPESGTYR